VTKCIEFSARTTATVIDSDWTLPKPNFTNCTE